MPITKDGRILIFGKGVLPTGGVSPGDLAALTNRVAADESARKDQAAQLPIPLTVTSQSGNDHVVALPAVFADVTVGGTATFLYTPAATNAAPDPTITLNGVTRTLRGGKNDVLPATAVEAGVPLLIRQYSSTTYRIVGVMPSQLASKDAVENLATRSSSLEAVVGIVAGGGDKVNLPIGAQDTTASTQRLGTNIYVFDMALTANAKLTRVVANINRVGDFIVYELLRDGDAFTIKQNRKMTASELGERSFPLDWAVSQGSYFGVYGPNVIGLTTAFGPGDVPFFNVPLDTMKDADGVSSSGAAIKFRVEGDLVPEGTLRNRVSALERELEEGGQKIEAPEFFYGITAATVEIVTSSSVKSTAVIGGVVSNDDRAAVTDHPATASGMRRYDMIGWDGTAITAIAGAERASDPEEYAPRRSTFFTPIARVQVGSTGIISADLVSPIRDRVPASVVNLVAGCVKEARRGAPKFLAKVQARQPVRVLGFGDSITCQKGAQMPTRTTINGQYRDASVTGYLSASYGADTLAGITTYTAAQLGRADDGAGQVHTRVGWNWSLVSALEARGYVLGTDLWYDNAAVGGFQTSDAWANGAPTSWLTTALAVPADLVCLCLGMNELGNVGTEDRMVSIVNRFKDAGRDVVLLEVPRPANGLINWRFTNSAIRRAAARSGVGSIPFSAISDGSLYPALGVALADITAAGSGVHPGPVELQAYGALLAKLVDF